ncbi:hypothetical protein E2C01_044023 [Portunus trituberculatus]|uniref:Uncharacterized protein n=1 Tax=Portunus trituberculatus TaxID=210409 RepID=A0A5B7FQY7_PORTR|nr:hypothetical protein [Portunus trituberculatus]
MAGQDGLVPYRLLIVTVAIETIALHRQFVSIDRHMHVTAVFHVHSEVPLRVYATFASISVSVAVSSLLSAASASEVAPSKGSGWYSYRASPVCDVKEILRFFASLVATGRRGITHIKRLHEEITRRFWTSSHTRSLTPLVSGLRPGDRRQHQATVDV